MFNEKEYFKSYRQKNKEIINENHKKWRESNKEKIKEYSSQYRQKNKEKIAKKRKQRAKLKLDKSSQHYRVLSVENFLKRKLQEIIRKKRYNCEIDINYLLDLWNQQKGKCAISMKKMEHCVNTLFAVSVDRIDSKIGYIKGNIQLVCQGINFAKNDYSNDEFLHFWKSKSWKI